MATVRAIAADNEQITNTELIVTSALASTVTVFLPAIGDGTASTVTSDSSVTVYANGVGAVIVKDQYGHMIGSINPGETASFNAHVITQGAAGVAQVSAWRLQPNVESLPLKAVVEETVVGASAALAFTANTNAAIATPGTVNRYLKFIGSDGLPLYVPAWR